MHVLPDDHDFKRRLYAELTWEKRLPMFLSQKYLVIMGTEKHAMCVFGGLAAFIPKCRRFQIEIMC